MQTTSTPLLSAAGNAGAVGLFALARDLFVRLTGGHDGLGFNVLGVPSVTAIGADGRRVPVLLGYGQGEADDTGRAWRPARELVQVEGDRRLVARVLTPQTIAAHVRGSYSVAVEAAGWCEWVAVDIDAHAVEADGADGPRLAKARARRVLGQVLAALGCGGERWPVLLQSPGGGFHLWLPITRGQGADHRWPASWAAAWFRHHLAACGVELRDGACEVYPSGRRLRAPCGRGSVLLRVVRDDVTDPLALEPWPGTFRARTLWSQGGDPQLVRRPAPMLAACLGEWDRQRRTIADWTGRPEAAWDPCWGFLGRRGGRHVSVDVDPHVTVADPEVVAVEEKHRPTPRHIHAPPRAADDHAQAVLGEHHREAAVRRHEHLAHGRFDEPGDVAAGVEPEAAPTAVERHTAREAGSVLESVDVFQADLDRHGRHDRPALGGRSRRRREARQVLGGVPADSGALSPIDHGGVASGIRDWAG